MRFRQGEVVRVAHAPAAVSLSAREGVVVDVAGPNEEGTGWNLTVRVGEPGVNDTLVSCAESSLEATGMVLDEHGGRVPLATRPAPEDLRDRIELRLFTMITNGIEAARVADEIEAELLALVRGAAIAIVAERHWSEPYNYELAVSIEPLDDPKEVVDYLSLMGDGGWISVDDDGWRFELCWSAPADEETVFLAPEIHGAQVTFLPWRSPRRRAEAERPLTSVLLRPGLEENERPGGHPLDPEAGDEES
jgi:hypothetical protein